MFLKEKLKSLSQIVFNSHLNQYELEIKKNLVNEEENEMKNLSLRNNLNHQIVKSKRNQLKDSIKIIDY